MLTYGVGVVGTVRRVWTGVAYGGWWHDGAQYSTCQMRLFAAEARDKQIPISEANLDLHCSPPITVEAPVP
jgi:hypothetical protein